MSAGVDVGGWFARRSHPRLAALVLLGAAVGGVGTALAAVGGSLGPSVPAIGFRLAILGYLAILFGATGYVAFAAFDRVD